MNLLQISMCLFFLFSFVVCEDNYELKKSYINDLSALLDDPQRYTKSLYPSKNVPLQVNVIFSVMNVREISEVTMTFRVDLFLVEEWNDYRLVLNNNTYDNLKNVLLHKSFLDQIWYPDLFFPNVIESVCPMHDDESVSQKNSLFISSNGDVSYGMRYANFNCVDKKKKFKKMLQIRLDLTARCLMNLRRYPFDYQMCQLVIEPFSFNPIDFTWGDTDSQRFTLPEFRLLNISKVKLSKSDANNNSQLVVCFTFERISGFYFMELYIPAGLIVIIGWFTAISKQSSIGDLVGVIMAKLFLYFSYITVMPKVNDFKAMDLYLVVCFGFIFLSFLQKLYYTGHPGDIEKDNKPTNVMVFKKHKNDASETVEESQEQNTKLNPPSKKFSLFRYFTWHNFWFYLLLPICFFSFVFIYFVVYMHDESEYNDKTSCKLSMENEEQNNIIF